MGVAVVEEAVDHEERALSFLSARRSPRAGLGLIALSGIAFSLAYLCFFFNWPRNDDLQLVELVTDWNAHSMTLRDVLASRNAEHPIGMQALAHLAIFETFGENYKFIVLFNDLILIISAATLFVAVRSHFSSVLSIVIAFVITLILFHPVQTDSLIWPYQTGWFLINLAFIINICLIERFAWKSLPLLVLSATCATLSSRHGIIAWPVMAVQLALLGGWRNWVAALIMFIGLAAALVAVPSTNTTSLPGIADAGGFVVYVISLVGGAFGDRDPERAFGLGAVLLACAAIPVGKFGLQAARAGRAPDAMDRVALSLMLAAGLCVAAFALGRYAYGLPWALDRFHASTMMSPFLLGVVIWWTRAADVVQGARRAAAALPVLLIVMSAVNALAFARERSRDDYRQRALAMLAMCSVEAPSTYLLNSIHGLSLDEEIVKRNMKALKGLCGRDMAPEKIARYAVYPV